MDMTEIELPEPARFSFTGRSAIVTGSGSGVGEAIARMLHVNGAKVLVSDAKGEMAEAVATSLDPRGQTAMAITLDVRDKAAFIAARDRMLQSWGKIDIVVNNAGWAKRTPTPDITPEEFDDVSAVNMRSVFLSCQIFSEPMTEAGYGRIVNITSIVGASGNPGQANYAAAKAGVAGLTRALARELGSRNITVNCIAPGFIDTDMTKALSEEQHAALKAQIPLGRLGQPQDIADAVAFLASPQAGYITGVELHVNGGMYMN